MDKLIIKEVKLSQKGEQMVETDLMSKKEITNYIIERKLNPDKKKQDKQFSNLEKFIIYNSFTSNEVEEKLKGAGLKFEKYTPEKSKESHFYTSKTKSVHIVNTKDTERLERDENLILGLEDIFKKGIELEVIHYRNNPAKAAHRFKEFAFNLVDDVFNKTEEGIKEQKFINIIMGPFESFKFNDTKILHENDNDYLNYKIIRINNKLTISFDYIFAGQADDVLNNIFSNLNANLPGIEARIFHYGKVGVLNKAKGNGIIKVGDICIPNAFVIEKDLEKGKSFYKYFLENELNSDKRLIEKFKKETGKILYFGSTVNTKPILKQTRLELIRALKEKVRFLEMEWERMGLLGMGKKIRYPHLGQVKYYLAASASDDPLNGINLGNTDYKREENEVPISDFYKKIISES